ncbi:MAG: GNAT family N-acetyltransferase [candidate division Zixibacteria bacterium]|nr:GNAT family N-acetyltransferase [candidate division Zixibacteria bacterium]MBU1469854.1 GNAT family N-acetyltransferase [candidate division Zixibacteria bacterium]MBU2626627.1 GNAT family N-acetyltransferase [candidate division Zixibacteria bacterium]
MTEIVLARTPADIAEIRKLFREYAASLDFDLCFQDFDSELEELPGDYAPPSGRLFLATVDSLAAGCVALRRLSGVVCEMKRLYVRPEFRGLAIGRQLVEAIVKEGREAGYRAMRLDTLASMEAARNIYRSLGFVEIEAYRYNPIEGAVYMEMIL